MEYGKLQPLYVVKKTPVGLFLNQEQGDLLGSIQLNKEDKEQLGDVNVGDLVDVYIYKSIENKDVATLKKPIVVNGEIGILEATSSNRYGAFLNIGYDKDVLLPFSEQLGPVKKGHKVLAGLYTDKSGRLCATQKVRKVLGVEHAHQIDDIVDGTIYEIAEHIGAFVAIDNKYFGLILSNELMPNMKVGDKVSGRITKIRDDGKMNMTPNKRIDVQMDEDSAKLYELLVENDGFLPYHDKTDSETIKRVFHMSKKAFKRAIGKLYKEKRIDIKATGIYKLED